MIVQEVRTRYLLPEWMKADAYDVAVSDVLDEEFRRIRSAADQLTLWNHIDELPEDMLDELAWALHIEWYDTGAPIDTKRQLVRSSDFVHAKKGTVAAVESVIRAYFGDGYLMEWPDYGGDPHHFKVFTTNPNAVAANQLLFEDMLAKVKRHTSKCDSILISLTGDLFMHVGSFAHDYEVSDVLMGDDVNHVFGCVGVTERETALVTVAGS